MSCTGCTRIALANSFGINSRKTFCDGFDLEGSHVVYTYQNVRTRKGNKKGVFLFSTTSARTPRNTSKCGSFSPRVLALWCRPSADLQNARESSRPINPQAKLQNRPEPQVFKRRQQPTHRGVKPNPLPPIHTRQTTDVNFQTRQRARASKSALSACSIQ